MRNVQALITLFAVLLLGLMSQRALAQQNNLARLYFVTAEAGHAADLDAAIQQHAQWRKQNGDPWTWMVMQVVNGEHLGDYVIRSGEHSWADFDAYDAGFGPKGGAHWEQNVVPHIASITSAITTVDTTNVRWPEDPTSANLISVTTFHLKPGHGRAFTQAVSKFHHVIAEHNRPVHYAFEWNENGPTGQAVSLILPFENWSAMEGPDEGMGAFMVRVMGEEEAMKVFEQFDSTYHSSESMVVRVRPDLSVIHAM